MHPETIRIIRDKIYPFPLERLPTGYILASGNLVDCKLINEEFLETLNPDELPLGDYTLGRYVWIFEDIKHLPSPILAKGAQGFWDWKVRLGIEVAT